ncbi:MAG: sensor histidine kinase [Anaerolineaceae bacterium]
MVETKNIIQDINEAETIKKLVEEEIRSAQNTINDASSSLEKMRQEVNKLTQRNTDISTRIQQTNENLESIPRLDIKSAYENALDAQKRYLLIRGQLEKVQSDQQCWQHYQDILKRIDNYLVIETSSAGGGTGSSRSNTIDDIIKIEEAERTRLSKLMHDGPAQTLTNFILQTEIALRAYEVDTAQAKEELNSLKTSAMKVFQRVRNFIFELKPFTMDDQGLIQTLKKYFDAYKDQTGIDVSFKMTGTDRDLEHTIDTVIFRSIQELLYNVSNYSQASLVTIQIEFNDRSIEVLVEDNGKGFDIAKLSEGSHSGLDLMKERIEGLGGKLLIDSNLDVGTRVKFNLPAQKDIGS